MVSESAHVDQLRDVAYDELGRSRVFQRGALSTIHGASRPNAATGVNVNEEDWDVDDTGLHRTTLNTSQTLANQTNVRPIFQGEFNDDALADRLKAWHPGSGPIPDEVVTVRFDPWGHVKERKTWDAGYTLKTHGYTVEGEDFTYTTISFDPGSKLTHTYRYDGVGRLIQRDESPSFLANTQHRLYHDADGRVIEELVFKTLAGATVVEEFRQTIWSPVTGEVILRDRDKDANVSSGMDERHVALVDGRANVVGLVDAETGAVSAQFYYLPSGKIDRTTGVDPDWRHTYQQGWYDTKHTTVIGGFHYDVILTNRLHISAGEYWNDQYTQDVNTDDPHASGWDYVPVIGSIIRAVNAEDGLSATGYWLSAAGELGLIVFAPAVAPVRQAATQAAKEGLKLTARQQLNIVRQHLVKGLVTDITFDATAAGVGAFVGYQIDKEEGALKGAAWGVGIINVAPVGILAGTGIADVARHQLQFRQLVRSINRNADIATELAVRRALRGRIRGTAQGIGDEAHEIFERLNNRLGGAIAGAWKPVRGLGRSISRFAAASLGARRQGCNRCGCFSYALGFAGLRPCLRSEDGCKNIELHRRSTAAPVPAGIRRPGNGDIQISMRQSSLNKLVAQRFGELLAPHGFVADATEGILVRRHSPLVIHFISPALMRSDKRYRVFVFPSSPILDPYLEEHVNREAIMPTDIWSQLNERGVSAGTDTFGCRDEEQFNFSFERRVKRLLLENAVPYLDQFKSFESIIPFIRHDIPRIFALWHLGRKEEAVPLLKKQKRLPRADWLKMTRSEFLTSEKLERLMAEAGVIEKSD